MVDVVVEFDYKAVEEDELSIQVGDLISNVQKHEGGWWEGELNGKKGMFPDNFVREIKKEKDKPRESVGQSKKSAGSNSGGGHVAEIANRLGNIKLGQSGGGNNTKTAPAVMAGGVVKRDSNKRKIRAKVAYSYTPANEDELRLEVGDFIEVMKQEEEGWWEGNLNGKVGMFPSNFVEVVDEDKEKISSGHSDDSEKGDSSKDDFTPIHGKKVKGVGLGNIFSDGPIKLRSTTATSPRKSKQKDGEKTETSNKTSNQPQEQLDQQHISGSKKPTPSRDPPTLPPKEQIREKSVERAKVIFAYTAENDDELTIDEGDIVNVLEKELEDSGWWKGELNGKVGVFPDNFVELLPEPQAKPQLPVTPPSAGGGKAKLKKPLPPDPEKEKTTENSRPPRPKEEPRVEDKGNLIPAIPAKQPVAPPPVGKKPLRPADPRLIAQTDDHKVKESQKDSNNLDSIEPTEKLSNLNANRAKAPIRRPPSSSVLREKEQDGDKPEEATSTVNPPPRRPPALRRIPNHPQHEDESVSRPPPPEPKSTPSPRESPRIVEMARIDSSLVEELQRQLRELRGSTVSRTKYDQLMTEVQQLKESFTQLKSSFHKRTLELMNEIDEEKKIRLNMQVELERIKKLVTS